MATHMCGDVNTYPPLHINYTCPQNVSKVNLDALFYQNKSGFEVTCELYIILILCICGLTGNILSLVVLRNDQQRKETSFLLQALACVDGVYLIVAFWRYPMEYLIWDSNVWTEMQPYVFPLLKTMQTCTIWVMVLVTVDRYVYVSCPLQSQRFLTSTKKKYLLAVVILAALVYNTPRFFESCIMRWYNRCSDVLITRMVYHHAFSNTYYFNIYQYGLYLILLYICPLIMLCVMNAKLIWAIQHSKKYNQGSSSIRSNTSSTTAAGYHSNQNYQVNYSEANATVVLIIIVVAFIICQTPELISKIIIILVKHLKTDDNNQAYDENSTTFVHFLERFQRKLNITCEVLMVLNSSVNFFIYVAFGRRFRYILKETFKYFAYSHSTVTTRETVPLQQQAHQVVHIIR